jgi:hypothetical protein
MVKKQHISSWTAMKNIQTQSEAFMNLKLHTNVVEAIYAFYKGDPIRISNRVLDLDPGTGSQKIFRKKRKK